MASPQIAAGVGAADALNKKNGVKTPSYGAGTVNPVIASASDSPKRFDMRRYRPMGVSDIFDESFDLYKNNFTQLLIASALVYVPMFIILDVFFNPLTTQFTQSMTSLNPNLDNFLDLLDKGLVDSIIAGLLFSFAMILSNGAVGYLVGQRYLYRNVTIGAAYSHAARRLWTLTVSTLWASFLGIVVGGFVCGFGTMIAFVRWAILPQVAVLENLGPVGTVTRCWRMTGQGFWRISMVLTMLFVMNWVLQLAIAGPLQLIEGFAQDHAVPLFSSVAAYQATIDTVVNCFIGLLLAPFGVVVMTITYFDIRIRDEGFDMAILGELLGHVNADEQKWVPEPAVRTKTKPPKKVAVKVAK